MTRQIKVSYAVLAACVLAHFMNHMHTGIVAPFLPVIKDELGLSFTDAGVVASAAIFTQVVSHFGVGYMVDRGWGNIFIPASILGGAIIVLVSSLASTFLYLAFCMALLGVGVSPYHPSAFPALTTKFSQSARAKATGIQSIGGLIGTATIPVVGVSLLNILGSWRDSMFVLAFVGIMIFIPALMLMRVDGKSREYSDDVSSVSRGPEGWTRNFALVFAVMGLRSVPFRCTTLLMPLYLVAAYGYDPFLSGSMTTLMLAAGIFGQLLAAPLSDRLGKRVPFIVISTGLMAPCLVLLTLSLEIFPLFVILACIGFSFFFGVPSLTAFMTEVSPVKKRGLAFGILFSFGALPGAISPVIFGALGDMFGLSASILFLAALAILASIISLLMTDNKDYARSRSVMKHV
ncbi:MAG: MFS transporter [Candidatus Thorarchaeota archaeon]